MSDEKDQSSLELLQQQTKRRFSTRIPKKVGISEEISTTKKTSNSYEHHQAIAKRKNSIFSQFKSKLKEGLKNRDNNISNLEEEAELAEEYERKQAEILKQSYYSLLCAALDPVSYVHESHNFQMKTFGKLTTCDECKSVLWGIHKQGLQCSKCSMCVHEKCLEVIQEDCSSEKRARFLKSSTMSSANLTSSSTLSGSNTKLDTPTLLQHQLAARYEDLNTTFPNYFPKLKDLFSELSNDTKNDVKLVQQHFYHQTVKQIKTRLRIFVKNAVNLVAADSCGTSDPYVTIQCGFSKLKRTKTIKKNLNPIWNEYIEFEYFNTADGIFSEYGCGENKVGNKVIIRVWDEDYNIKSHFDRMFTNEQDDFLGQIVLNINELNLNGEQPYKLKQRTENDVVSGYLVLSISMSVFEVNSNFNGSGSSNSVQSMSEKDSGKPLLSKKTSRNGEMERDAYIEQYRYLHKFIFDHMKVKSKYKKSSLRYEGHTSFDSVSTASVDTNGNSFDWLLECLPNNFFFHDGCTREYFSDQDFNMMLRQFSNRYVISELQKQMIHLECFYNYFIDSCLIECSQYLTLYNRDHDLNCQILDYMSYLLNKISDQFTPKTFEYEAEVRNLSIILSDVLIAPKNFQSNIEIINNRNFVQKTFYLPNKLIILISDYRNFYNVKYKTEIRNNSLLYEIEANAECKNELNELTDLIELFKSSCNFIHNHIEMKNLKTLNMNKKIDEQELTDLFDLTKLKNKYPILNRISLSFFTYEKQIETLKKCVEVSLVNHLNKHLNTSDIASNQSIESDSSSLNESSKVNLNVISNQIETLINVLSKVVDNEIELNSQIYFSAFQTYKASFEHPNSSFRSICVRILIKKYLCDVLETVRNDPNTIMKLRADSVKLHLNLYLIIQSFLSESKLDGLSLKELISYSFFKNDFELKLINEPLKCKNFMHESLNEFFQPFLIEFIQIQEDQFIKYINKIYDSDKIRQLAKEIASVMHENDKYMSSSSYSLSKFAKQSSFDISSSKSSRNLNDIENYYSPSVTDLFTILHELLQTVLLFDSKNSDTNMPHQICFVNLIKSKLLTYSALVKKEYQKIYRIGSTDFLDRKSLLNTNNPRKLSISMVNALQPSDEFTITTCILMNNFLKTAELLGEIENKLKSKSELKQVVVDQLESIKVILNEDLNCMIKDYAAKYKRPLRSACELIQMKIYEKTVDIEGAASNEYNNLINQTLYNVLNDKFIICRTILFESIFKMLLEEIFKITVESIEESIILKADFKTDTNNKKSSFEEADEASKSKLSYLKMFKQIENIFSSTIIQKSSSNESSLLNQFQYKTIKNGLKHVVDFFSADGEFLNKYYLLNSNECQSAFKTLDLYLLSSKSLIENFIQSQNVQQNNIDFTKSYGKVRLQCEIKQNAKAEKEFSFCVCFIELRDLIQISNNSSESDLNSTISSNNANSISNFQPFVEVTCLGPKLQHDKWSRKIIKCAKIDPTNNTCYLKSNECFEFKISFDVQDLISLKYSNEFFLTNHELQINVYDASNSSHLIGLCVFNLNEVFRSASVWKRLKIEDLMLNESYNSQHCPILKSKLIYGAMDLWLHLRPRLKIDSYGEKILKVLDRHLNDRCAMDFIKLKVQSRHGSNLYKA